MPVEADMHGIRETIEGYRYQQQQKAIVIPVQASPTTTRGDIPDSKAGYANGGRATEASIFGEAGAEWAIPEQHTARTADLLKAAAAASGFTWAELLSSRGGLNGASSTNIVFSPQITTAGDTGGIKAALEDAQRRFFAQLKRENIVNARVSY